MSDRYNFGGKKPYTLTALPSTLYSSNKGRTYSASINVETITFTGPIPLPTWSLVSSVV